MSCCSKHERNNEPGIHGPSTFVTTERTLRRADINRRSGDKRPVPTAKSLYVSKRISVRRDSSEELILEGYRLRLARHIFIRKS
ncbi:hypothetical protein ALC62_08238 [Cyphomyrmex costatus]|uniref:Uncharacterized protein n=1 Tax=Cyphomyrmex costatus TaxID=456900 RepID=A0A195CKN0_9HYME|nr:hypothetical protein ALC62_08238 [Cyphomyrmex costatus]